MTITPSIFEAFLKCPTKCWLRFTCEPPAGNAYAEWPFNGAVVPGYPTLHPLQAGFWPKFWKLYAQARHPDAGKIVRPSLP